VYVTTLRRNPQLFTTFISLHGMQDAAYLSSLSLTSLQDRLYDLDARFRRDMAALTEKYDAARSAVESAIATKAT
jgi:hypothetical protein